MKALLVLMLSGVCAAAMADEAPTTTGQIPVEHYHYNEPLDIARVLSMSPIPNVCAVVPTRMTYEDSGGHRHVLEYQVMGNGCSNG
ncbi:DUF2790 domain-containing protein [Pseudomonas entomophila]|uniref:DUF2790 domain-containing protein n=1 Tax=Pseudomonas entomophila TaxID=312306 RepID=UPI0015E2C082|nr:DUF2790 domain-containing protein [Pseudomonas entomophila]MBA1187518.1 DUF2790 domain-containing protein [Pseudomonas entomophila]